LEGEDSSMSISGAYIGTDEEHHDDTVFISHNAERCESRQVFKKVLRNKSTGVFQGKILVDSKAQKTDGYQISKGLLLDSESSFFAKPELEIYADDVICSHGSTCGAVDDNSLFYLTSRGIPKPIAVDMMIIAFIDESIQEIQNQSLANEIRTILVKELESRIE
jgi:Fe-S cluster assembly protein SufD